MDRSPAAPRTVAACACVLVLATIGYVVPSALHGNPPVESAAATLDYVAARPTWRAVHQINIAAVVAWAAILGSLPRLVAARSAAGRWGGTGLPVVWAVAGACFAVYFALHSFALPAAADQLVAGVDRAAVMERTEAVLLVLGATAFTGQALLGTAVLVTGGWTVVASAVPRWIGWLGVVAGAGWLVGALVVDFAVIVPSTVLAWVWTLALASHLVQSVRTGRRVGGCAS